MNYIGIDLGTTNSVICSFDGVGVTLYKSPDQKDITPSALFYDRRGNKFVGSRAYDQAALTPANAAVLFKRFMGTSTPIKLPGVDRTMTPEECSAEVLKMLYSYLPENIRNSSDTVTVITVPAAFNQMQKDATLAAAEAAVIGQVALMQEPVAAVMSVMRTRKTDGIFLIFDLGGGTLDIAVAESINGNVSLLSHGGIPMCGGRDFDREIFDNIIKPWLHSNFQLPLNWIVDEKYAKLRNLATWAGEKAKIELSQKESTYISSPETEVRMQDESGNDIYLNILIERATFDLLIEGKLQEAIQATRDTLGKVGLTSHDIERIVFVGGPTQYKPLREKVAFELGIASNTDVNPMTAVAEGAAIFAESLEWSSVHKNRKSTRGSISSGDLGFFLNYVSRTASGTAKFVVRAEGVIAKGSEFQVESIETGWTSGRAILEDKAKIDLPLSQSGPNRFKLSVFDPAGGSIKLSEDEITISRTMATIDAIPASHSIGIEVQERPTGAVTLDYLVREGDPLPVIGRKVYKAVESLSAGGANPLRFKLWEGEIREPVHDNNYVGVFNIKGSDFLDGVIAVGADLFCDYEISDSGAITLTVTVPSIGAAFKSDRNFYSRQEAQVDYSDANQKIVGDARNTLARLSAMEAVVKDENLDLAKGKLQDADSKLSNLLEVTEEDAKQAGDRVLEAKRLMAIARKIHLKEIRLNELEKRKAYFDTHVRELARQNEILSFENLYKSASRNIEKISGEFEALLDEMWSITSGILWRQDWYVSSIFDNFKNSPSTFTDKIKYEQLINKGDAAVSAKDIDGLKSVIYELHSMSTVEAIESDMYSVANIFKA
jgi:molecular chaperone DnaK